MAEGKKSRSVRVGVAMLLLWLTLIVVVQATGKSTDFAIANIVTLILGFAAWVTLLVILFRGRVFRLPINLGIAALPIVAILGFLCFYRPVGFDSELIPQFRYRFANDNRNLPGLPEQATTESLKLVSDADYPGFLGADRTATLADVEIETDWSAKSPSLLWKQAIGSGWSAFAISGDMAVTLEQRGDEEWVSAYRVDSGVLIWKHVWPALHTNALGGTGPRSTPTIFDGVVYAHGATGKFVALDQATGTLKWEVNLLDLVDTTQAQAEVEVAWGRSGSPLIWQSLVIVPLGGRKGVNVSSLIAFDRLSGKEVWRAGTDQIGYASPTLLKFAGVEQVVSVNESSVSSHDPATGKVLWTHTWPGGSNGSASVSQPIAVDESHLLLSKHYGTGAQLLEVAHNADDSWQLKEVWADAAVLKTKFTNLVLKDGYAYGLSDGILECVSLKDGKRKWKQGRYRHGQILRIGSTILVSAEDGSLALVAADPEKYRELSRIKAIEGVSWNNPAIAGNRLFVRNGEQAACFQLTFKSSDVSRNSANATDNIAN